MPEASRVLAQEIALLDHLGRLDKLRHGRTAIHIHISNLAAAYRRDNYIRIAANAFVQSVHSFEGRLFTLANKDLVFVARDVPFEALNSAVDKLRSLFAEDPIAQFSQKPSAPDFCTWYNLETDYEALRGMAQEMLRQAEQIRDHNELHSSVDPATLLKPIRPELVARLEDALGKTDISNIVRRQTACTLLDGQPPQPLFEEIFVSIEDLQGIATPGIDLLADVWLFRYLTQTLDRRVMAMLIRDGVTSTRPFSINLNVATVLSPEFGRFETTFANQLRGRLVVEMNKIDVFSDMGAFLFARDYLHELGFRICLDGLTHHTMAYYDRERLGFDLVKLYWTPDSIDNMRPEMMPIIRANVMETGQARTILCRCDSPRAIEIGQDLGIVMFQGRHVDHIYNTWRSGNRA